MPEDNRIDDVEKFLTEQKSMEDRKQALIADLLKERDAAIKAFDQKLERLGYQPNSAGRLKRSHHKSASQTSPDTQGTAKGKTKA